MPFVIGLICSLEVTPLVSLKDGKRPLKGSTQRVFLPLLSQIFSVDAIKPFLSGKCPCKAHHWNGLVLVPIVSLEQQETGAGKPSVQGGVGLGEKLILMRDV